jgi:rSAM/selenodomain-associated transferase 1
MPESSWVIVFAKAPEAGRVKTRLAAEIGEVEALRVYRDMAEGQWKWLRAARDTDGFHLGVSFAPAEAEPVLRAWLAGADAYLPQIDGNLGDRIASACAWALDRDAIGVTVMGSDCPGFNHRHLQMGLAGIQNHHYSLGPAMDGGFYALTLTPQARPLLDRLPGIPWSSSQTSVSLIREAESLDLVGILLPELRDLDTLEDLVFYQDEQRRTGFEA